MSALFFSVLTSLLYIFISFLASFFYKKMKFSKDDYRKILSFSFGILLATSLFSILPFSLKTLSFEATLFFFIFGFLTFLFLENFIHRAHCKNNGTNSKDIKDGKHCHSGLLNLVGDFVHNFIEGIGLAVAYITSIPMGISITLAGIAHEIPKELSDYAILLKSRYSLPKATKLNLLVSLPVLPGVLLTFLFLDQITTYYYVKPLVLTFLGGMFLYIAIKDFYPQIILKNNIKENNLQAVFVLFGLMFVIILDFLLGSSY